MVTRTPGPTLFILVSGTYLITSGDAWVSVGRPMMPQGCTPAKAAAVLRETADAIEKAAMDVRREGADA